MLKFIRSMLRPIGALTLVSVLLAPLPGCRETTKHYALKGQVLAKDESSGQLLLDGDDVPGFMPAMIMKYSARDTTGLHKIEAGDRITADVVVKDADTYWLDRISVADDSKRGTIRATPPHELLPGEKVPDVPLVNQDGKELHLADFRGKLVLLTFIYTRCPYPKFCPLISSQFAKIHAALAQTPSLYARTLQLSISLDPEYDTPPVLRKYGLEYLKGDVSGFAQWNFASVDPTNLQLLALAFGLTYYKQNNAIVHSMNTILLAADGTIKQTWPGNDWKPSDLVAAIAGAAGDHL